MQQNGKVKITLITLSSETLKHVFVWHENVRFYLTCFIGTPITRIPIMAKQPLDLYKLYQHVVAKGGLLEVGLLHGIWQVI